MEVQIDVSTLNFVVGVLIPILVGLVTKKVASRRVKSAVNAVLSAVAGVLVVAIANDGVLDLSLAANGAIVTFVVSIATYYGLWKPTGVSGQIDDKTGGFGIGKGNDR